MPTTKPLSEAEQLQQLLQSIKDNLGVDIEAAFSDDIYVCKNCGHEYVGERLCPECGR